MDVTALDSDFEAKSNEMEEHIDRLIMSLLTREPPIPLLEELLHIYTIKKVKKELPEQDELLKDLQETLNTITTRVTTLEDIKNNNLALQLGERIKETIYKILKDALTTELIKHGITTDEATLNTKMETAFINNPRITVLLNTQINTMVSNAM